LNNYFFKVAVLIDKIITTYGQHIGQIVPDILRASLLRLSTAKLPSLIEGLLVVFIRLIIVNFDETLQFLASHNYQENQNALESILNMWVDTHDFFSGEFKVKLSILGLMKIFQHQSPLIDQYVVKGDIVEEEQRSTRKKEQVYVQEPLKLRIFKILIREHLVTSEKEMTKKEEGDNSYDSEDWGSDDDPFLDLENDIDLEKYEMETGGENPSFIPLSALWEDDVFVTEEVIEDPSILSDPIYAINTLEQISNFMKSFSNQQHDVFMKYVNSIPQFEKTHLKKILDN